MSVLRCARACLVLAATMLPGAAAALCDVTYKAQSGDTLTSIAELHYGSEDQWPLIYYSNLAVLDGEAQTVPTGADVFIPCPAGSADPEPESEPLTVESPKITLLTGGGNAPFTDRNWPANGMITELVTAALGMTPAPLPYIIEWDDDWSRHLLPLLNDKTYDMGFPWMRPDCVALPDDARCVAFHYSAPLMDLPIMLFKRADDGFSYESDADVVGRTLCRPKGYFTHDLNRADRRWLADGRITLVQPGSPEECFEQLMTGQVDAVTLNMFLGMTKIVKMGLRGRVVPLDRPLSNETLHVVISKTHWRGTTHLYRINAGLAASRASGRYDEIMARHLAVFEERLK